MRSSSVVLLAVLASGTASATTVYKCIGDNEEVVFAESPCGTDSQRIVIEHQPPADSSAPTATEVLQRILADKRPGQIHRRLKKIDRETARYESRIRRYRQVMEYELEVLQHRKRLARNNLAGATLENSISREMQVVVDKYQGLIADAREKIHFLNDEKRLLMAQS